MAQLILFCPLCFMICSLVAYDMRCPNPPRHLQKLGLCVLYYYHFQHNVTGNSSYRWIYEPLNALQKSAVFSSVSDTFIPCSEKRTTLFLPPTLPNANRFSKSFTNRLSSKFLLTKKVNISPHLKRVVTLPSEIVVFKNRNDPELCEECHASAIHDIYWKIVTQRR